MLHKITITAVVLSLKAVLLQAKHDVKSWEKQVLYHWHKIQWSEDRKWCREWGTESGDVKSMIETRVTT